MLRLNMEKSWFSQEAECKRWPEGILLVFLESDFSAEQSAMNSFDSQIHICIYVEFLLFSYEPHLWRRFTSFDSSATYAAKRQNIALTNALGVYLRIAKGKKRLKVIASTYFFIIYAIKIKMLDDKRHLMCIIHFSVLRVWMRGCTLGKMMS